MVREAARVVREVGTGLVTIGAFCVAALTRFLGIASSAVVFSLSSLEISSLLRFFARVADVSLERVAFTVAFVVTRFDAGLIVS